jgi:acyl dehydratase
MTPQDMATKAGEHLGTSEWAEMSQERINQFAEATGDHQFIHIDEEKAKLTPFGGTIAHGFLTLSLLPHLTSSIPQQNPAAYEGMVMGVNYGLDKVRFPSPVPVNSKLRAHRELMDVTLVDENTLQTKNKITVEIEGSEKPACVAEFLSRMIYG